MSNETPSDATLIAEHLQGSSTALMQLWLRYDGLVYGIAHSMVCRQDVAEDIRQDVFVKVQGELPRLQAHGKFASWLRSITYNACGSWLRQRRSTVPLDSLRDAEHPSSTMDDGLVEQERRSLLRQMIDRLPWEYREVIELHYFEENSVAQIAEFLELPASTVKWRIHQARETLRRQAESIP